MERYKTYFQTAFVLHTRPYRETSLLLELFTRDEGRVGLIAKGVRKAKSTQRALLQPFTPLRVSWSMKGELGTLTAVERDGISIEMRGSAIACGFYMNELLSRLLERHDPHPALFETYQKTLLHLNQQDKQAIMLRFFEKKLLEEIGYGLNLDHDANDDLPINPNKRYQYIFEKGAVAMAERGEEARGISGSTLIALDKELPLNTLQRREARLLLRDVLSHYLGDKPLKSREMLRMF